MGGVGVVDWSHRAECREMDPEIWFPVGTTGPALARIAEAKAVCHRCPVRAECLDWALAAGVNDGVWGGTSEDERRALRRRDVPARRGQKTLVRCVSGRHVLANGSEPAACPRCEAYRVAANDAKRHRRTGRIAS